MVVLDPFVKFHEPGADRIAKVRHAIGLDRGRGDDGQKRLAGAVQEGRVRLPEMDLGGQLVDDLGAIVWSEEARGEPDLLSGSTMWSKVNFTASALNGVPSWKLTPSRRANV